MHLLGRRDWRCHAASTTVDDTLEEEALLQHLIVAVHGTYVSEKLAARCHFRTVPKKSIDRKFFSYALRSSRARKPRGWLSWPASRNGLPELIISKDNLQW